MGTHSSSCSGPRCSSSCVPRAPQSCSLLLQVKAGQPALLEAGLGFPSEPHVCPLVATPQEEACSQSQGCPSGSPGQKLWPITALVTKGWTARREQTGAQRLLHHCSIWRSPRARRLQRDLTPGPSGEASSVLFTHFAEES